MYFMAGAVTALAVTMQHKDSNLPWWLLIVPAIILVGLAASAPGVVR